jgi:NAD(P)-dependent dehydrogenase (short-subunit alcohol dehydrogenase family)
LFIQALLPNILKAKSPKVCIVSSRVGSVGDNSSGGHYAYRSSKAAVNSIGKSMAMDLKDKGVTVLLLHPGFVQTNILPKTKMPPETVQPEEAARKLWENVVKKKGIEQTGTFWHREGFELPW